MTKIDGIFTIDLSTTCLACGSTFETPQAKQQHGPAECIKVRRQAQLDDFLAALKAGHIKSK